MGHPCWNGGPGSCRIECTKFNEGCTKFCEGCTKGPKMHSEVGIDPKSFCYGFLNEIMTHPCSNGGPGITRLGYTKFCEGCTKGPKVHSDVGIDTQSLTYGVLNEIVDHPCWNGGLEICRIECTKFNEGCTKFNEGCTKFCEGCTKGPEMSSEVGIDPQSLCYGFLKAIMDHPCWNEGLGIHRIGCTKFH